MNTSEIKPAFVDYRFVPNYTDHAAVESALQQISQKFKTDGAAVAATFAIEDDPREAITAVSRRFNVTISRLEWGAKPEQVNQVKMFDVDGERYTFAQMMKANEQDQDFCAWLQTAKINKWFPGVVAVKRVR